MRLYVAKNYFCFCGKAADLQKLLAPLSGSRLTLKEYIGSLLH